MQHTDQRGQDQRHDEDHPPGQARITHHDCEERVAQGSLRSDRQVDVAADEQHAEAAEHEQREHHVIEQGAQVDRGEEALAERTAALENVTGDQNRNDDQNDQNDQELESCSGRKALKGVGFFLHE